MPEQSSRNGLLAEPDYRAGRVFSCRKGFPCRNDKYAEGLYQAEGSLYAVGAYPAESAL